MSTNLLYHAFGIRGYRYSAPTMTTAKRSSPFTKSLEHTAALPAVRAGSSLGGRWNAGSGACPLGAGQRSWPCQSHVWNVRRARWCVRWQTDRLKVTHFRAE